MSKYYTPSIEEFHVGFEFEDRHSNYPEEEKNWISRLYTLRAEYELDTVQDRIKNNKIRVKHLDREDIESLGWVSGESYGMSCYLRTDENGVAIIDGYQLDFHSWELVEIYQESTSDLKFSGTIKNKSELKQILKQLGI
tara:strand:- start:40 stop:456 length:417 start_codon:yes stop_codon:yes gene_type:complete